MQPLGGDSYQGGRVMRYVFADCELDTQLYAVRRGTTQRPLRPKPFQVLLYLLEHCDRVVPKQELAERLWPEQYVSDSVIENSILAARQAVGDSGRERRIIQTLYGHGYRFVAPVTVVRDEIAGDVVKASWTEALARPSEGTHAAQEVENVDTAQIRRTSASLPIEATRRRLTVLSCQLVGATDLARQIDPEDYADIIRAYHAACVAVIQRFEGHIAQHRADGLLVYFGYPQAYEDDAQRAVHTALGMVEILRQLSGRLQSTHEVQVAVRIGIHTGLAVMSVIDTRANADPLALGETPNLAAQLQELAAPDTVVLSATTYRLVHGYFACQPLGAQSLGGLVEPIEAYQVLQASGVRSRFAVAVSCGLTPLVGRQHELGLLLEQWMQAKDGTGRVVLISGEVGIGKSRLVQALKEQVRSDAQTLFECQGSPYHQHTAFWPLIELLPRVFQWQPDESTAARLSKMAHVLAQVRLPVEDAVPLLATLLALPLPEDDYPPLALTPEHWRQKTFETLLTLLLGMASQHPVLFIVEDLHWLDPSTLEFLELLIDQSPTAALLTVLTCRPTVRPSWVIRSHATHVTLDRLGPELVQEMIGLVLGEHQLPAAVRHQIVATTNGVPLFVEEVTKMVLEMGNQGEGAWDAAHLERAPTLTIPATLHDLLMARLDRLGAARGVAQLASTIGKQFSYALLQALALWDESTLQRELGRLVETELLYQRGLPPRATYLFKHVLIRDVAYASLLKRTRQHYHQNIARTLEARFPETAAAQPELLAYHLTRGEAWDRAFAYLVRSGDKARQIHANQEAMTFYTQAIEASGRITPTPGDGQLLPAYEGRGLVWRLLTRYDEAIADFHMMRQLAQASGNQHKEGESLCHLVFSHWLKLSEDQLPFMEQYVQQALKLAQQTGNQHVLARSLTGLGLVHQVRGNLRESDRQLRASLQVSRREGYHDTLAPNLLWLSAHAYWQGDFPRALHLGDEGLVIAQGSHDGLIELLSLAFLCQACWSTGHYGRALTMLHDGMTKATERKNLFIGGRLLNTLGWFHRECGDAARAVEYDRESLELGRTSGVANVEISALINLGWDYLARGQHAQAFAYLNPTLTRVEHEVFGTERWRWRTHLLLGLAELSSTTGAYDRALRYVEAGIKDAQATSLRKYVALGWALRGKIAGQLGDAQTAGAELLRAFSLVDKLQSPALIYPLAYDLGHWYESTGKEEEARRLYGKAQAIIGQMATAVGYEALRSAFLQSALVQTINERVASLCG
jgi:class 3 adenylate cyclase/tetratricopeptide (TPR) repeat protein